MTPHAFNRSRILLLLTALAAYFIGPVELSAQEGRWRLVPLVGGRTADEGGRFDPADSPLREPFGIAFDSEGHQWIVELGGGRVLRGTPFTSARLPEIEVVAGTGETGHTGDGGPAAEATFNGPHNLAVAPDGGILVADSWNHCVRRIDPGTGSIETVFGTGEAGFSGDGGPADQAQFNYIMCITLSPDETTLYLADLRNRRIRAIDLAEGTVRTVAGNGERGIPDDGADATFAPLVDPRAVAADGRGNVYILERGGHALRVVRADGTIHTVAGTGEAGLRDGPADRAQFNGPKHLCVDPRGRVFIADDNNHAIRLYDPRTENVTTIAGRGQGAPPLTLKRPHGVAWYRNALYIVDSGNNRILRAASAAQRRRPAGDAPRVPDSVRVIRDITYATYGDREVQLDLYLPRAPADAPRPAVVVIHGGGWRSGNKERFARFAARFADEGYVAACVGYRLIPEVDIRECVTDCKAAVRWLRAHADEHHVDAGRIGAVGGSAGAHLTAMLATSHDVEALEGEGGFPDQSSRIHVAAGWATPADMSRFRRAADPELAQLISPLHHVDGESAPIFLMHSRTDRTVPFRQSEVLRDAYREAGVPVTLVEIEEAPHAFWNQGAYFSSTMDQTLEFFEEHLKNEE